MKKKKIQKEKEGYTLAEMRALTDRMIDESMDRLRMRLRAAWKKQTVDKRRAPHEITV